jgi:hypothetical protein
LQTDQTIQLNHKSDVDHVCLLFDGFQLARRVTQSKVKLSQKDRELLGDMAVGDDDFLVPEHTDEVFVKASSPMRRATTLIIPPLELCEDTPLAPVTPHHRFRRSSTSEVPPTPTGRFNPSMFSHDVITAIQEDADACVVR